jgi:glycolate oxidase
MAWAAPPFHRRGERTIGEAVATASGDERVDIRHVLLGADVIDVIDVTDVTVVTVVDGQTPARFGVET